MAEAAPQTEGTGRAQRGAHSKSYGLVKAEIQILHNVPEAEASAAAWQALGFEIVEHLRVRHLPARS